MTNTVFMIHGMWGGPFYWEPFRSVLEPAGWHCIATTLPFHDADPADPPDPRLGRASLLDYAAALEAEIAALPAPPVLIGHSMGGLLAQMLCARGRARAAVLLAPASPAGIFAIRPSVLRSFLPVMLRWGFWRRPMRQPFATAVYAMLHRLPETQQRETYARFVHESGRAAAEIGFWPLDRRRASHVDPARVTCPLLVLTGAEDRITPAPVVRQVARRYGAGYHELDGHAHWLMAEPGWEAVAARVLDWLDALPPAAA